MRVPGPHRAPGKGLALPGEALVAFLGTLHPWEDPCFGLGPAHRTLLPLPSQKGCWATFPTHGIVPYIN